MKYVTIKLTKEEALKTLTILKSGREYYEEAKKTKDHKIYLIAKEWLEDINATTEKIDSALTEYYKAPF